MKHSPMHQLLCPYLALLALCFTSLLTGHEQAKPFRLNATTQGNQVVLTWQIAPKHWLYKNQIKLESHPKTQLQYQLPEARTKPGTAPHYTSRLRVRVKLPHPLKSMRLVVHFQGCKGHVLCYPPMKQAYTINHTGDTLNIQRVQPNWQLLPTLLTFFGLGVLLAFTPCMLPLLPITCAMILGNRAIHSSMRALCLSSIYVFAMALTYAAAGMIAASLGSTLQSQLQTPWVLSLLAFILVFAAGAMLHWYPIKLPNRWQRVLHDWTARVPGGTYLGVALAGFASVLVVTPCVSAPFIGALGYISTHHAPWLGGSALFAMGLGMGVPIIAVNTLGKQWLPKTGPWMHRLQLTLGITLGALALWFLKTLIDACILHMLALLWLAYWLWLLRPHEMGRKGSLYFAACLVLTVTAGNLSNRFKYEDTQHHKSQIKTRLSGTFTSIKTPNALKQALAQRQGQTLVLDFSAKWCTTCRAVRKTLQTLQSKYPKLQVIEVDITDQDDNSRLLQKSYHVFAPPAVIVLDPKHQKLWQRFDGELALKDIEAGLKALS